MFGDPTTLLVILILVEFLILVILSKTDYCNFFTGVVLPFIIGILIIYFIIVPLEEDYGDEQYKEIRLQMLEYLSDKDTTERMLLVKPLCDFYMYDYTYRCQYNLKKEFLINTSAEVGR